MRASNIELLRIIAMAFVVLLHCNFASLGYPSTASLNIDAPKEITKMFFENICIISVNCFILISGFFSIRLSLQRLMRFCLHCLLYGLLIYVGALLLGLERFTFGMFVNKSLLWWLRDNWFICCYLALMLFAPLANILFENTNIKQLSFRILLLLTFDCIMGWLIGMKGNGTFGGYSVFHLLVVYCLGRFISKVIQNKTDLFKHGGRRYLWLCAIFVLVNTVLAYIQTRWNLPIGIYAYNAPIVLLISVCFFLFFLHLDIGYNRFINFVAKSSFSVFLIHIHPTVFPLFKNSMNNLFETFGGYCYVPLTVLMALLLYGLSIFLDFAIRPIEGRIASFFPYKELK